MAEWLKILIGALAGLLVGILSEPLKSWTSGKLKEREMRSALYSTMADLLGFYESGRNRLGGHPKPASRGHLKTGQLKA
jgi:hypothetical protein